MRLVLRALAVGIAFAGLIDPALARRAPAPLAVEVRLPEPSHPGFARADALGRELLAASGETIVVDGWREPQAIVAIGDAEIDPAPGAPVFYIPVDVPPPAITIRSFEAPPWSPPGQAVEVTGRLAARGMAGQRTTIALHLHGAPVATVVHEWTSDDEVFDARLAFAPTATGAQRVTLVAHAGTGGDPVADALIKVRDQPLRVLAFDARPTWPVTFARRSLEADGMFEVAATSRSSRPVATIAGGAPGVLGALDVNRYDAVLVGALDELSSPELRALDRFVSERGGTLVLAPDRRIPAAVARQLGLPDAREVLLDRPVELQGAAGVRASELLLLPHDARASVIASAPQAGGARPAVALFHRGEGQIIVCGLMDAWRFRGDDGGVFDDFWRSLMAGAALASRPPIDLRIERAVARPGDSIEVTVQLRPGDVKASGGAVATEAVEASLITGDGRQEMIRLWPGARAGLFEGRIHAPAAGGHTVRAAAGGSSVEAPLLTADDVVQPARARAAAWRHAAAAPGGAVVASPEDARRALAARPAGEIDETVRPMRSPWWIVPFAGLLCAEWTLRRRSGLK